jgi:hypothetical protein
MKATITKTQRFKNKLTSKSITKFLTSIILLSVLFFLAKKKMQNQKAGNLQN